MGWRTRPMSKADVPAACAILNEIIAAGGTTAYEKPFEEKGFVTAHLGPDCMACHVVLDAGGSVAGFQWLGEYAQDVPEGAVIASFTRRDPPARGAGRALFAATLAAARAQGVAWIQAKIRADNVPGLGYYSAMGFLDDDILPDIPLADGTRIDRIVKKYTL